MLQGPKSFLDPAHNKTESFSKSDPKRKKNIRSLPHSVKMLLRYGGKDNYFHSIIADHNTEKVNMTEKMVDLYELFKSCVFSNLPFKENNFFIYN